ncbi:MAG: hypothetical protein AAB320_10705 [Elusimicrobiota bacterium]
MKPAARSFAAVFFLGLVLGGLIGAWCQRSALRHSRQRPFNAERVFKRFDRELKFDEEQKSAVKAIIHGHGVKLDALQGETAAAFDAVRQALRAEIKAQLKDPEQLKRFAAMEARWEARRVTRSAGLR